MVWQQQNLIHTPRFPPGSAGVCLLASTWVSGLKDGVLLGRDSASIPCFSCSASHLVWGQWQTTLLCHSHQFLYLGYRPEVDFLVYPTPKNLSNFTTSHNVGARKVPLNIAGYISHIVVPCSTFHGRSTKTVSLSLHHRLSTRIPSAGTSSMCENLVTVLCIGHSSHIGLCGLIVCLILTSVTKPVPALSHSASRTSGPRPEPSRTQDFRFGGAAC